MCVLGQSRDDWFFFFERQLSSLSLSRSLSLLLRSIEAGGRESLPLARPAALQWPVNAASGHVVHTFTCPASHFCTHYSNLPLIGSVGSLNSLVILVGCQKPESGETSLHYHSLIQLALVGGGQ